MRSAAVTERERKEEAEGWSGGSKRAHDGVESHALARFQILGSTGLAELLAPFVTSSRNEQKRLTVSLSVSLNINVLYTFCLVFFTASFRTTSISIIIGTRRFLLLDPLRKCSESGSPYVDFKSWRAPILLELNSRRPARLGGLERFVTFNGLKGTGMTVLGNGNQFREKSSLCSNKTKSMDGSWSARSLKFPCARNPIIR